MTSPPRAGTFRDVPAPISKRQPPQINSRGAIAQHLCDRELQSRSIQLQQIAALTLLEISKKLDAILAQLRIIE